jgi:hypothetical protein
MPGWFRDFMITTSSRIYVRERYLGNGFHALLRVFIFGDDLDGVFGGVVGGLDLIAGGEAATAEQASHVIGVEVMLSFLRDLLFVDSAVLVAD